MSPPPNLPPRKWLPSNGTGIRRIAPVLMVVLVTVGCVDSTGPSPSPFSDLDCSIPTDQLFDGGVGLDGIPSLQNPSFVGAQDGEASYLLDFDRVIGLVVDGQAWAIPHNILWWHEIVNVDFPSGLQAAVTYCPLTGSSLVFDRSVVEGATLGVSGVLFRNNLVIWDRNSPSSLWLQMGREARCGPADGTRLPMVASIETTWAGWKELHPDTRVISGALGFNRDYTRYPYGSYEQDLRLLFPQGNLDNRRFAKERVLGIPEEDGRLGIAFPFEALRDHSDGAGVVETTARGGDVVVFWDEVLVGAMAYRPEAEGLRLTFRVEDGRIHDEQTGSEWRLDGLAVGGPLAGSSLEPVAEAFVAFWFAWAAFHPDTELWEG